MIHNEMGAAWADEIHSYLEISSKLTNIPNSNEANRSTAAFWILMEATKYSPQTFCTENPDRWWLNSLPQNPPQVKLLQRKGGQCNLLLCFATSCCIWLLHCRRPLHGQALAGKTLPREKKVTTRCITFSAFSSFNSNSRMRWRIKFSAVSLRVSISLAHN